MAGAAPSSVAKDPLAGPKPPIKSLLKKTVLAASTVGKGEAVKPPPTAVRRGLPQPKLPQISMRVEEDDPLASPPHYQSRTQDQVLPKSFAAMTRASHV